jgi:hypothetical protein
MKLGELLELAVKICSRRLLDWSRVLYWLLGILLLSLCIGGALLVSLVVLRLGGRLLLCIFLLLVMRNRASSANHNRRAHCSGAYPSDRSSHHCSST